MNRRTSVLVATLLLGLISASFQAPAEGQEKSSIRGRVARYDFDPQTGLSRPRGSISGVEVVLLGKRGASTILTDNNGLYRFSGLDSGTYTVTCKPSSSFLKVGPAQYVVELYRGQEAAVNFALRTNGRIEGRVLGESGEPLSGIPVDLLSADQRDSAFPHVISTVSREGGKYVIDGIPPGIYVLGIRLSDKAESDLPYPRIFYGGVTDLSRAAVLTLKEAQNLEDIDLLLPHPFQRRTISGTVQLYGKPAAGSWVSLKVIEYPYASSGNDVQCDQHGQFKFSAFAGLRYSALASGSRPDGKGIIRSDVVQLPASEDVNLQLDLIQSWQPMNLLHNPDAGRGSTDWKAFGDATVEAAVGHDSCFSVRNKGYFLQDVPLPKNAPGQYAVMLGFSSSERTISDRVITGLPYLYGYMMNRQEKILAYLQGQQMRGSATQPDGWDPVYGVFMVPPETTTIRYFLNQAESLGVPQNGSAARFDDLGLYLLPTELEAKLFLQSHFNLRTN